MDGNFERPARQVAQQVKRRTYIYFGLGAACVILLCLFLAAPWPAVPIAGRLDEGVYALGGAEWAHGHVPYRDFWDNKPPSIYLINALAWRVSGGLTGI
jgi:hypothetical protein